MKKIKVGIPLVKNSNWLGGYNYIINLLEALDQIPNPRLEIIVFGSREIKDKLSGQFKKITFIYVSKNNPLGLLYWTTKFIGKYIGNNNLHELLLSYLGISVLAYSSPIGKLERVASICWIPDFQHIYLPNLFPKKEVFQRNKLFKSYINDSTIILLSSNSARKDLEKFSPKVVNNLRILKFVSCNSFKERVLRFNEIEDKYNIPKTYFHLPNQFWKHKNHNLVAEAVKILNDKNIICNVVCTGNIYDYRNPEFFSSFLELLKVLNVEKQFKILGVIPYEDMISLMNYSQAVINPSLFEGWSTSVEESKILNKKILLSDIPVHKEQNPIKGKFFSPSSPLELSQQMEDIIKDSVYKSDYFISDSNNSKNNKNILEFALNFENIALDAVQNLIKD